MCGRPPGRTGKNATKFKILCGLSTFLVLKTSKSNHFKVYTLQTQITSINCVFLMIF
ncbi:hypothetical protein ANACOL_03683 [Anaerotruncus colihominis DSM 17241]|uniref:Uncharacterized protein n=1 Tax=Anaerotruncus colihominis DSM 17241 TaxID=445972 RepID=B0PFV1_9FIRM|nr:hypothetical protein ANACOL_03683 [Anaerotruncus colihominis DSM 17241]